MNRYSIDFDNNFWKSLPFIIQKKNKTSMWYRFLYVLLRFFFNDFQALLNELFNQIFIVSMNQSGVILKAADMRIYQRIGETEVEFESRLEKEILLRNYELNINALKAVFSFYLNVEAVILQSITDSIFQIGVTPIGVGKIYSSSFYRFTWKAILPDLSEIEFNKKDIIKILNEFSCSCEFFIYEQRENELFKWEE